MINTTNSKPVMLMLSAEVSSVGKTLAIVGVTIIRDPIDALLEEVWLITDETKPIDALLEKAWLVMSDV